MNTVRFAIIGLDHWYSALPLAEGLAAAQETELVAIVDDDAERARPVAERLGAKLSTDVESVLNDPDIDAVGCFFSVDRNPEICVAAAEAGKHIVSIKPLARTLDEAKRVVEAVRRAGVQFIPAETRSRMTPQNQLLRELVSSGAIGDVVSANFTLCGVLPKPWPDAEENGGWWLEADRAPGGGWIDHSIYQIDRLRWLMGADAVEVMGRAAKLRYTDLPFEDYGHAIITFSNGVVATFEDTWTGADGAWRITTTINGTLGSIAIDTAHGRFSVYRSEGGELPGWAHLNSPDDDSDLIQPIIDRIHGKSNSLGDVEDAYKNLATSVAFYESARSGRTVSVTEVLEG